MFRVVGLSDVFVLHTYRLCMASYHGAAQCKGVVNSWWFTGVLWGGDTGDGVLRLFFEEKSQQQ